MSQETLPNRSPEHEEAKDSAELERIRDASQERLKERLESQGEQTKETQGNNLQEALEKASSSEKIKQSHEKSPETKKRRDTRVPKKDKQVKYRQTMKDVQSELPVPSRVFSKFIHARAVERTSEVIGSTVARPNAILAGSLVAFVFTLSIFLVARHYGYPLSGAETLAGFGIGWIIGLLIDYLRIMITGKAS